MDIAIDRHCTDVAGGCLYQAGAHDGEGRGYVVGRLSRGTVL